jgi:hypothetical protein
MVADGLKRLLVTSIAGYLYKIAIKPLCVISNIMHLPGDVIANLLYAILSMKLSHKRLSRREISPFIEKCVACFGMILNAKGGRASIERSVRAIRS